MKSKIKDSREIIAPPQKCYLIQLYHVCINTHELSTVRCKFRLKGRVTGALPGEMLFPLTRRSHLSAHSHCMIQANSSSVSTAAWFTAKDHQQLHSWNPSTTPCQYQSDWVKIYFSKATNITGVCLICQFNRFGCYKLLKSLWCSSTLQLSLVPMKVKTSTSNTDYKSTHSYKEAHYRVAQPLESHDCQLCPNVV